MAELTYKSTYPPIPNSRTVSGTTAGIARNLNPLREARDLLPPAAPGGGDLNGTAALVMLGQAGTAAGQIAVPRRPHIGSGSLNMGIGT